ncbi:hypothetical protein P4S72_07375 [Vibrio sp. PP-XX7]
MDLKNYPHISQHWHKSCDEIDLKRFEDSYVEYWSHRSCGIACVLSILKSKGIQENLIDLFKYGIERKAYCDRGWIHSGLADLIESYGLNAQAKALSTENIIKGVNHGKVYIISVTHQLLQDGKKGGHLILLNGVKGSTAFFMDHFYMGESHNEIDIERLFCSYSGRCIEVY